MGGYELVCGFNMWCTSDVAILNQKECFVTIFHNCLLLLILFN